jgi:formiminotetrahydrofolate cyclodeaminase
MRLSERSVADVLEAVGARTPAPASGSVAALCGVLAAALAELAARFAGDEAAVADARALAERLAELADEDSEAYTAFMADRSAENRARIVAVPQEIAACAERVAELAARMRDQLRRAVAADAEAGEELARAVARVGHRLAELNA